jgi:4-amino-4-deoxy-L-arabinose transferase-like glycosyltransferase
VSRWAALLGLAVLTCLVGVGRPAIQDADEAFYAESGREMVASGNWITPHFNGVPRTNKPILFYWLVALDDEVAGVNETSARLWSAVAGVGLALLTGAIARRWFGPGPDLIAGGIVATSLGLTRLARSALPDVPLAFFVTIAIWAATEGLGPEAAPARRRRWLCLAAVAVALGFLTKGPVAIALPAVVLGPTVLIERWGGRRNPAATAPLHPSPHFTSWPISWLDVTVATVIVIVIVAPWFVLATDANGWPFLRDFFVGENVDRFLTDRFNPAQPPWYYAPVIVGGLLPWSPFLLLLVGPLVQALRRRAMSTAATRLGLWAIGPAAFFTASTGKQPRYIVPCLVPIAVLVARDIWRRAAQGRDRLLVASGVLTGLTLITLAALAYRLAPVFRIANPGWTSTGPLLIALSGVGVIVVAFGARGPAKPLAWIALAGVTAIAVEATVFWPTRPEPVEQVAAWIDRDAPGATVSVCGAFTRNLGYYAHVKTVVVDTDVDLPRCAEAPEASLAVLDDDTLAALERVERRTFERLLTIPYLDTARVRVGDLVRQPDPTRVRHVVLIRLTGG